MHTLCIVPMFEKAGKNKKPLFPIYGIYLLNEFSVFGNGSHTTVSSELRFFLANKLEIGLTHLFYDL